MLARILVLLLASSGTAACLATNPCADRAYPEQSSSDYVLPYALGSDHVMVRGNCEGFHIDSELSWFAYDFDMAVGESVAAARSGQVTAVETAFEDGDHAIDHANFVEITHTDGSVARYARLTVGGASVALDDTVAAGDRVGFSGDTGRGARPHLHFVVLEGERSIPMTFRNTTPHPNGLQTGVSYPAEAD